MNTFILKPHKSKGLPYIGFCIFFLIGLFGYGLRAVDFFSAVPGNLGDPRFNSVILEHVYRWIIGQEKSLWSPPFFYPFENLLAFSDNHFGSVIFYTLFRLIGLSRELAFDAWFLMGFFLSFLAAYWALRRMKFSDYAAAAGAFIFAYALPMLHMETHAQLVYRFAIPLAFLALWELWTIQRLYPLWKVVFWVTLQFYCSIYNGLFLVYLLSATLFSMLILKRHRFHTIIKSLRKEKCATTSIFISANACCVSALFWLLYQYYKVTAAYNINPPPGQIINFSPNISVFFTFDSAMYFGVGVWALCFIGVAIVWRERSQQKLGLIAAMSFFIILIVTTKFYGYSIYLLFSDLPGIKAIRVVSRISVVLVLPLTILAAISIDHLIIKYQTKSHYWKLSIYILITIILSVEVFAYEPQNSSIKQWRNREAFLEKDLPKPLPADPILFVVRKMSAFKANIDGMILAQNLGIPTLNGYSGNPPPGVKWALGCTSYLNRLYAYAKYHHLPLSAMTPIINRLLIVDPESTCKDIARIDLNEALLGKVTPDQAKKITLRIRHISVTGKNISFNAEVVNHSSKNLNTYSISGHDVKLSWRFVPISTTKDHHSEPGWDTRNRLVCSIPPNETRTAEISGELPKVAGKYLLEVSLVQEGVWWLHDIGMQIASREIVVKKP